MKHAVFTFGRFNPPTEAGHGKLVDAVKSHAEKVGGDHYVFPSHSQDAKKNPLSHADKVSTMRKVFPGTNVVSHKGVKTAIDALKHLESKGYTHATMVVGSDRVKEFHGLLNKYNGKEYNFKKIHVKSAGNRDPDAEGAEGMSASKLRGLVKSGKRDEFISHYSNKKVGAEIHDKVKAAMNESNNAPLGIFLFGGPGSGKDYLLKNIFSRFDLLEVQADQILNGSAKEVIENSANMVINCSAEGSEQIEHIKSLLEGYDFDHVFVSVSNKVSRERNLGRQNPLNEDARISKMLKAEKLAKEIPDTFVFNNSLNLNECSEMEKIFFASQIQKLLERIVSYGLVIQETPSPKSFVQFNEDLRTWFKQKWVRMDTKGNIAGECARDEGEGKPKCLPLAKARAMDKKDRKRAVLRKRRQDPVADREGKGNKPVFVATEEVLMEKNAPTNPDLWARAKALAKQKFDVYPSAYANGWAAKWYKSKGGGWKSVSEEVYEIGTDASVQAFKAMTPGENNVQISKKSIQKAEECACGNSSSPCDCGGNCGCAACEGRGASSASSATFKEENSKQVKVYTDIKNQIKKSKKGVGPQEYDGRLGINIGLISSPTVAESVEYHLANKISFTENVYRPGSEMFFALIGEAKKLYAEGKYAPKDEYELEVLTSNIGEKAMYEGKEVLLDFPFEVLDEEGSDPTKGHGIGKPFRKGGGGAVYVRSGDGVKLVNFSQSGMTKKYNDPGRLKSFMARHNCLGNKDKTSASYWACRWPRYFSKGGQQWW